MQPRRSKRREPASCNIQVMRFRGRAEGIAMRARMTAHSNPICALANISVRMQVGRPGSGMICLVTVGRRRSPGAGRTLFINYEQGPPRSPRLREWRMVRRFLSGRGWPRSAGPRRIRLIRHAEDRLRGIARPFAHPALRHVLVRELALERRHLGSTSGAAVALARPWRVFIPVAQSVLAHGPGCPFHPHLLRHDETQGRP